MADTVYIHGVSAQDVLATLPMNTTAVSANSNGLNFGLIDGYIERAAGQVNAQLTRHGMDPAALDPDSSQIARDAIIAYAAAQSLERAGAAADQIERRLREWRDLVQLLKREPQAMGASQGPTNIVKTNITEPDRPSPWRGRRTRWT